MPLMEGGISDSMLMRHFSAAAGWVLIAVGLLVFPLPIPFGAIMIVVGIALVAPTSPFMQRLLKRVRSRFPAFSRRLDTMRDRMPKFVRELIDLTRPDEDNKPGK